MTTTDPKRTPRPNWGGPGDRGGDDGPDKDRANRFDFLAIRGVSMTETKKDLKGIRGWLLFYLIGPMIFGTGSLLFMMLSSGSFDFVSVGMLIASIVGILAMMSPWTWVRTYHIALNAVTTGFFLLVNVAIPAAIGTGIWVAYWLVSKRVKATYWRTGDETDMPPRRQWTKDPVE